MLVDGLAVTLPVYEPDFVPYTTLLAGIAAWLSTLPWRVPAVLLLWPVAHDTVMEELLT